MTLMILQRSNRLHLWLNINVLNFKCQGSFPGLNTQDFPVSSLELVGLLFSEYASIIPSNNFLQYPLNQRHKATI